MKTILLGTTNKHKVSEIQTIFKNNGLDIDITIPLDYGFTDEPIEDGNSFEENAIIKAKFYYEHLHMPCLCEDSGICIEYFNNYPGIYSKRFMSNLNDHDKNDYVLKLMNNVSNRKASFHDVACYIDDRGSEHIFEGINFGEIALKQEGDKGFGYDPIFYIPQYNKTEAQLGEDYKNEYSHRALAIKKFINYVKEEN